MATIGTLTAVLEARTASFERSMKTATAHVERFAAVARRASAIATVGLAAVGTAGFALVKVASEAEELQNVIQQSFGSMADEINDWAEETGRAMGRSTYQMQQFSGTLQAMLVPMVGSVDDAAEMSKSLSKLAVDLGSFFNVADDQALIALRSALVGETEPMRRFGVVLTEAQLSAFALERGIMKDVRAMSEAEKTTLRYQYILDRTRMVQGDAVRTIGAFQNQTKALQADIRNISEDLGKLLLPTAQDILSRIRALTGWVQDLDDATKRQIVTVGKYATGLLAIVAGLGLIGMAIQPALVGMLVFMQMMGLAFTPAFLIIAALGAAVAAFALAWKTDLGGIRTWTEGFVADVTDELGGIINWFKTSDFAKPIRGMVTELRDTWARQDLSFLQKVSTSVDIVIKAVRLVWEQSGLKAAVDDFVGRIKEIWADEDLSFLEKIRLSVDATLQLGSAVWEIASGLLQAAWDTSIGKVALSVSAVLIAWSLAKVAPAMLLAGLKTGFAGLAYWVGAAGAFGMELLGPVVLTIAVGALLWKFTTDWGFSLEEFRRDIAERIDVALRAALAERKLPDWAIRLFLGPAPGELERRMEERGFQNGAILPGAFGPDQFPALLAPGEAVVPSKVVQGGWPAVLDWFRSMGVPGFQAGLAPAAVTAATRTTGLDVGSVARMVEGISKGFERVFESIKAGVASLFSFILGVIEQLAPKILGEEAYASLRETIVRLRAQAEGLMFALGGGKSSAADFGDEMDSLKARIQDAQQTARDQDTWWKKITASLGALWQQGLARLQPIVDALASGFQQFTANPLKATGDALMWLAQQTFSLGQTAFAFARDAFLGIRRDESGEVTGSALGDLAAQAQATVGSMIGMMNPLNMFGAILDALNPAMAFMQRIVEALAPIFEVLFYPIMLVAEALASALAPVLKALFPVFKLLGLAVLKVARLFMGAWNAIAGAINKLLGWLGVNLPTFDLKPIDEAISTLTNLTWDEVEARLKERDAIEQTTNALRNVPQGFKLALRRFQLAVPGFAHGGIVMGPTLAMVGEGGPEAIVPLDEAGGGTTIIIEGDVYGWDDFKRKVAEAEGENKRTRSLSRYGA